nr:MAG TPA: hypothetical protein [Caudoviricetes sp.]
MAVLISELCICIIRRISELVNSFLYGFSNF